MLNSLKIFSLFVLMILVSSVSIFAQQDVYYSTSNEDSGSVYWQDTLEATPFLDRLKMTFGKGNKPFATTIIGGALCPETPNIVQDITTTSTQTIFCRTNTQHIGEAFQLFLFDPWQFLGEQKLVKGQQGCFNVQPNTKYRHTVYFCSDTSKQCTNWNPNCYDTKSGVMIYTRSCIEGSRTFQETSTIQKTRDQFNSLDQNAQNCGLSSGSQCFFGGTTCDGDVRIGCQYASGSVTGTIFRESCGGGYCSNGICVPKEPIIVPPTNPTPSEPPTIIDPPDVTPVNPPSVLPPAGTLSGKFSNVKIPLNVKPNKVYQSAATFTANSDGIYYLEAWINNEKNPLAIANVAIGSKCDGSKEASGEYFKLKAGQSIDVVFNTQSRADEGVYTHILGAYSECLSKGGKILAVEKSPIKVVLNEGKTGTLIGGIFSKNPMNLVFLVLIIVGVGIGAYFIWKKKK